MNILAIQSSGNSTSLCVVLKDDVLQYSIKHDRKDRPNWLEMLSAMGDNRDNSNDSTKDVGFVPRENFFGQASYLFMTWECWTCLPYFSRVGKIN